MPLKENRTIVTFKGDDGRYELETDFGGEIGNLVNLEDLDLTTRPAGKYRIVAKKIEPRPYEPTLITYTIERF
jgi:hypothetical protein